MSTESQTRLTRLEKTFLGTKTAQVASWIRINNPAQCMPYHNTYHSETVAMFCHEAASYAKLNDEDTRALVLAALFHDFGHSGGRQPDAMNIERAVQACKSYGLQTGIDSKVLAVAERLIRCTEYPYKVAPQDELECIIRDADMMQIMDANWGEMVLEGLYAEQHLSRPQLNQEEFVKSSLKFYQAVKMHSKWGRSIEASFQKIAHQRVMSYLRTLQQTSAH